jgi:hypothetical protein
MEKIIEFLKKNLIIVLIVVVIAFVLILKKQKEEEDKNRAIVEFDKLNVLSSGQKSGKDYEEEKKSLLNLVKNATEDERKLLYDLINGTIVVFKKSYKGKDQEEAKSNYNQELNKFYSDLVSKYGKENVMAFKAKMDKYGFDI